MSQFSNKSIELFDSECKIEVNDSQFRSLRLILNSEFPDSNFSGIFPEFFRKSGNCNKFQRISIFPENTWKKSLKIQKFDILSAKSISVSTIEWKWCPIHWNWPNIANSGKFPDFQKISRKIQKIFEIWYSESKINFSDWD